MTLGKRANLSEHQFENRKPSVVMLPALERPRKDCTARHKANSYKQKSVLQGSGRSMGAGRKKGVQNRSGPAALRTRGTEDKLSR